VVLKVTVVPFCTGVPACSSTVARISVLPLVWRTIVELER
jgi:hypothetical protein